MRGLSPVVASGGLSSSRCAGPSLSWPLLLRSTGSRRTGSVVVVHGPSCSAACGIFPDQGSNPCPLHWQADSQPLRHQGSPQRCFLNALRLGRTYSIQVKRGSWEIVFSAFPTKNSFLECSSMLLLALSFGRPGWGQSPLDLDTV